MSRGWRRSDLVYGEQVKIPRTLFASSEPNLVSTNYIGETDTGVIIYCTFKPSIKTVSECSNYKIFISWSSIWCGQIKLLRQNGDQIFAKRQDGMPVAINQYKGGYQF